MAPIFEAAAALTSRGRRCHPAALALWTVVVFIAMTPPAALGAFPGRNGKIAFVNYLDNDIYVANADGSRVRRLPGANTRASYEDHPAFSPSGRQLAFASNRVDTTSFCRDSEDGFSCNFEIYTVGSGGGEPRRVTFNANAFEDPSTGGGQPGVYDDEPQFTRSGREIVFMRSSCGSDCNGLLAIPVGGGNERQLVSGFKAEPATSPNGRQIAFVENGGIWVMKASGGERRRLTSNPRGDGSPDFSPDGRQIVFESGQGSRTYVYVMNANGTRKRRLALGSDPVFSPDGRSILYEGSAGIWVMNVDGSRARRVIRNPNAGSPAWQAIPR